MTSIGVAVINHNTCQLLRACLESVQREGPDQVVVVDNGSADGSARMVQEQFAAARLIESASNLGYGTAANRALAACAATYVLLLNSDTLLAPGALAALRTYLDCHPAAAIVAPRIVNPNGTLQPSCFPWPTPLDILLDVTHLSHLVGRLPAGNKRYLRTWSHSEARQVPWALGAALAIRRQAFEQVAGFDESYFLYYEEVDLCYRLAEAQWQVHFAPITEVVHVGSASTRQRPAAMTVQRYAGLAHFYRQHYAPARLIELAVLLGCIALARLVRDAVLFALAGDPKERLRCSANCQAWSRMLLGQWRKQMVA